MPDQQIIWTALPNGRTGEGPAERLNLSVVVSPRLRLEAGASGVLGDFADFHDWPASLKRNLLGFDVIVDDDENRPVAATIVSSPLLDSDLWKALFPETTLVRSQRFEALQQPISTYPVSAVGAELRAGYENLGRDAPFRPSDRATFRRRFADIAAAVSRDRVDGTRLLRERLSERRNLGPAGLEEMHRDLAASLLGSDPDLSFDDKLAATIEVAGLLARSARPGERVPLVPETGHGAGGFAQFVAFHRRGGPAAAARADGRRLPRPPAEEIDFHRMLTALGDYPWLMRRLGLVIELEIEASRMPTSSIGALRHLRVEPRFASRVDEAATYTPVTRYILDDTIAGNPLPFPVFLAAPRRAAEPPAVAPRLEIVGGLLNLMLPRSTSPDDLQFDVTAVDVDGAARKVVNAIQSMVREEEQGAPIDPRAEMPAPALQTSGLTLVRAGQAGVLMSAVDAARAHEADRLAGQRAVLFAEDLVRGYRIDVRRFSPGHRPGVDPEPPWLSLHERISTFRFKREGAPDITVPDVADEGFVQPVLVQEPPVDPEDPDETNPIYIRESYGHWQGWSLSAPFPTDPLDLNPPRPPGAPVSVVPPGLLRVEVTMQAAPRTLPLLRFGHHYQLRVRTVDLAGNGLTLEEARLVLRELFRHARPQPILPLRQEERPFRRFDPIPSPTLVLREELLEGEAVDVLVVRSNGPSTTTASYAKDLGDPRYQGFNDRHVVPPQGSPRMAERHGRLDAAFGLAGEPLTLFGTLQRGAGTLDDTFVTNVRTGEREPLPDVVRTDPVSGAVTTIPHGLRQVKVGESAPGSVSGYTVHCEEQLRLPYLPDPLAQGASLFNLPGLTDGSLVLVEGAGPGGTARLEPRRNNEQLLPDRPLRELGRVTKIGFPPAPAWPALLSFRLRLEGLDPGSATAPPTWSEVDGARMLTVRLAPAEVRVVWISTYPSKEDVGLFGLHFWWSRLGAPEGEREFLNMAQHGALTMLTPARKVLLVHAVQRPLMAPQQEDGAPFAARKFAGETVAYIAGRFKIHGASTEKLDLFASWTEPRTDADGARRLETHVLEVPIRLDAAPPSILGDPVPIATYTPGADRFEFRAPDRAEDARARTWLSRHEFGDTRHRRVSYRLVATTRFRDYFPERITRNTEDLVRATTLEYVVLNSARPPALEVSSIVPAFRWVRDFEGTSSVRSGGRLRVYLGDRWFATGEGEAVAVVGDPAAGSDPLHAVTMSPGPTTITPKTRAVPIAGQPHLKVYPFPVQHDPEVGLWYADLAFDVTDTYFPFIGLTLARFQEHSMERMQLSPFVEAGLYQLVPDRAVALAFSDTVPGQPGKRQIDITVSGARAAAAGLPSGRHLTYTVEVGVEERALGGPDDPRDPDLGWKPSPTVRPVVTPPSGSGVIWRGHVLVPAIAEVDRRIVVKEFEVFPPNSAPPGQAWSGEPAGGPSQRLVYADVIAVR